MDGVIYHGDKLVDGAKNFVNWLKKEDKKFLFLINSSAKSPKELKRKLEHFGIEANENHFITSAWVSCVKGGIIKQLPLLRR